MRLSGSAKSCNSFHYLARQGRWQRMSNCYAEDGELYRPSAPDRKLKDATRFLSLLTSVQQKKRVMALTIRMLYYDQGLVVRNVESGAVLRGIKRPKVSKAMVQAKCGHFYSVVS